MKYFILLLFTISFLSGCNFLRGDSSQLPGEDSLTSEEDSLDDFVIEEEEEIDEEFEEALTEELEEEIEMDEDFEGEEAEEAEEEMEEEKKSKKGGFFHWLFGGDSDEEDLDENSDSEFIGEDEEFSSVERDYEDYEENTDESSEDYKAMTSMDSQEAVPEQKSSQQEPSTIENPVTEEVKTIQKRVSLNKIMTVPYTKAGQIVNTVYIARPNEDISRISQKIYGRNEVDQLLKINPHLKNRSVVVGDKIYYNSPNRPNDNSRLLVYYQDNNISPSYYNLSHGDNIRTIATQLLGHPKSWKEIWAINPNLQSKSKVETSLSIVYWPQSAGQALYNNPTPPPAPEAQASQPETPNELAQEALVEPEPVLPDEGEEINDPLKSDIEEPEQAISNDIPPIEEDTKQSKGFAQKLLNNVEMIVGFIVFLILLYLIILIIMKKRKQRDFDYTATNIEM